MKKKLRRNTTILFALMSAAGLVQAAGPDWSGVYVGVDGVWGVQGDTKWSFPRDGGAAGVFSPQAAGGSFSDSPKGSGWGIHLGENRQFGNLVAGLEGSFAWTDIDATRNNVFGSGVAGTTSHTTRVKSLATLTPRVGYAFGNWLPYAKAGLALAEIESKMGNNTFNFSFNRKHLHMGWTAGIGVEYALPADSMGAWVFGLEYNYYQFAGRTYGGQAVPDNTWPVQYELKPSVYTVMLRASYNFGARSKPSSGGSSGGSWEGLYAGVDAVWGADGESDWKFPTDAGASGTLAPAAGGAFSHSPKGSGWGIHAGENRQFGNVVVGIEGSWAWTDLDATSTNPFVGFTSSAKTSVKSLATLTPRVGYAFGNVMPYAKLGLALAEVEGSLSGSSRGFTRKHFHDGWTAGLGVEYVMPLTTGNMVFGLEYSYYEFSSKTYGGQPVPDNTYPVQFDLKPSVSTVMARVSYKF